MSVKPSCSACARLASTRVRRASDLPVVFVLSGWSMANWFKLEALFVNRRLAVRMGLSRIAYLQREGAAGQIYDASCALMKGFVEPNTSSGTFYD